MKAIIIGSGLLGCGFVGQVLRASGYQVIFVTRNPSMVNYLNRVGQYKVRLVQGANAQDIQVNGVSAIDATQTKQIAEEIAKANLVATAVGGNQLAAVAPLIAAGLCRRRQPLNVIAFENLANAGDYLRSLVARHLPADFPLQEQGFSGALVNRAATQRLGDPNGDAPLTFIADPPTAFVVNRLSLRQPFPDIQGMTMTDNYPAWIHRKLYIFSAGHATCAYLGNLMGYHYIHTAIRDPEIRATVLAAMTEGQRGLAARYGVDIAGDRQDLDEIIHRFENAALNDPVSRVGRDPQRKLGADDRLVGAAQMATAAGIRPKRLALAMAAALCFYNPADPSAVHLLQELEMTGLSATLSHISGLDPSAELSRFVDKLWRRLVKGWHKDNLLLTLNQLVWSW